MKHAMEHGWRTPLGPFAVIAALTFVPTSAVANEGQAQTTAAQSQTTAAQSQTTATQTDQSAADRTQWEQLREKTLSARELMGADVSNLGNPVGDVRDLVLNEDSTAVQYVLYEIPYPYSFYTSDNGFLAFENAEIENSGAIGLTVEFADETAAQAPERLRIAADEADQRLLSRILGEMVSFAGEESREVEDVLIDRESGRITHYVVNMNDDSWFIDEPRTIAADMVKVDDDGGLVAETEFAALEPID